MSKHTPGEWLVEGSSVYALHGEPPRNRFSALVQSGRRDDASEEERIANAHLMAASPLMLEALRQCVEWHGRRTGMGDDALLPIENQPVEIRAAMRAIAAATKETQ